MAQDNTLEQVKTRLASPFHEALLKKTYDSLLNRLEPDGYFPESLTGAYPGMFPRTVGALGRLLIDTDRPDLAQRCVHTCLQAMVDGGLDHIPHIIGPRENDRIKVLDPTDQVDGQAHVILAWGLVAHALGGTAYEDATYRLVADLLDRTLREPYLGPRHSFPICVGLVFNANLEHSREGQFWQAYDFLTQSFVCAALEQLIPIAVSRNDQARAERWQEKLDQLETTIEEKLTRTLEGRQVYLEMLLPTGNDTAPFPGLGWINLAAIPAGWQGVDEEIFRNTIDTWHEQAVLDWQGPRMYSNDWLPEGQTDRFGNRVSNQIITKAIGWDLLYCLAAGQLDRVCEMLDFLEQINTTEIVAEAFYLPPGGGDWVLNDPGNGEQACWWCWAMVNLRKACGLQPLPD